MLVVNYLLETNLHTQNIEISISVIPMSTTKIKLYLAVNDSLSVFCGYLCKHKNKSVRFLWYVYTGFNVFLRTVVQRLVTRWHTK